LLPASTPASTTVPELLPDPLDEEPPEEELLLPPLSGVTSLLPDEQAADTEISPSAKIQPAFIRAFRRDTLSSLETESMVPPSATSRGCRSASMVNRLSFALHSRARRM
jgi:hypothetical protein